MSELDAKSEYLEFYKSEFGVSKNCTKSWGFAVWNHQQKKIDAIVQLVKDNTADYELDIKIQELLK